MSTSRIATSILSMMLMAACATVPPPEPTDWSASATASPGFTGAGANVAARSSAGGTSVNVAFREATGMSGTVRPWHVHYGQCGNDQGIVGDANAYQALRPGADGTAMSTATIPLMLTTDKSYFINIHKSAAELQTIVACGPLTVGMAAMTESPTTSMTSGSAYGGSTTSQTSGEQSKMIHVTLNEYRIDMPDSIPAGRVSFHVMNHGSIPHNFGIRSASSNSAYGSGSEAYDQKLPSNLQPGQMATLNVELKPGSYVTYCPVGDHMSAHGMTKTVTVK